jgi:hypothetical protein
VAAMSAIEALLCFPGERTNKDRLIADRLVGLGARVRGVPDDERTEWFKTLYGRWRNNAVHDARFYAEERDIERLLELSEQVIRWAIDHLDPEHDPERGSCETIDEVFETHTW